APFLRSAELPDGELTLNNRGPHSMAVTLRIHDQQGEVYELPVVKLDPGEVRRFSVSSLLPDTWRERRELGGIFAIYSGQWNEVATQLTLFSSSGTGSIDETLRLPTDYRSQTLESVWYMTPGARARVAIGNSSAESVKVAITDAVGGAREVTLKPHGTSMVEVPPSEGQNGLFVASLRINSQAAVGVVQAAGYLVLPSGGTHTIRFYDPAAMRSADLFATNLPIANRQVQLVLKNVGTQTL